jgi:hypothetical protein
MSGPRADGELHRSTVPTGFYHQLAFGLALQLDQRIMIPRLGGFPADGGPLSRPTRVTLDPAAVAREWDAQGLSSVRTRELRSDGELLLSVDFSEQAGYLMQARGIGRILISADGCELKCDPDPESPDWMMILPAQALPLAATLRGFEVFHAAGVVVGDRAFLLAGEPGAGKSSLAAAFIRRGAGLLSDDAVALEQRDGALLAHPGHGALHLRAAEHERLSGGERTALGHSTQFAGRQLYAPDPVGTPAPFAALFLLERSSAHPAVERLQQIDPFMLLAATFNLSVRTPERLTRQLDIAGALAATGQVYRVRVQPGTNATELAKVLHERFASSLPQGAAIVPVAPPAPEARAQPSSQTSPDATAA